MQDAWRSLVEATSARVAGPLLDALHIPASALSADELATSLLIALLQVGIIACVFRPLESWWPAERWSDRKLTRVDRNYTLLVVLGVLPLTLFLAMTPLRDLFAGANTGSGLLHAIPFLDRHPYVLFLVYYLVFDLVYYWMHRAQHAIPWWWALHSLHHSQRQVGCWTNHRDSLLDGVLESMILASVGIVLGVEPAEFALLMLVGELIQDFSHVNARIAFGRVFEKVIVGPGFHRLHHMRAEAARPGLHNCNFSQAFPVWDILFGTSLYGEGVRPTGVTDPAVDADNDHGVIGQQWVAARRFWGAVRRRSGWKPGDVSFGPDYTPVHDRIQANLAVPPCPLPKS